MQKKKYKIEKRKDSPQEPVYGRKPSVRRLLFYTCKLSLKSLLIYYVILVSEASNAEDIWQEGVLCQITT